jgi:hypothetical protein
MTLAEQESTKRVLIRRNGERLKKLKDEDILK